MSDHTRPNRDQGVFETLLVVDGRPIELEAHLARLEASLEALFPNHTGPDLDAIDVPVERGPNGRRSTGTSSGPRLGALRITVTPGGDGELEAQIEWRDLPGPFFPDSGNKAPGREISLHSFGLPGGLGAHKWADRSLLDQAQAKLPAAALPLILDGDGALLEASRANVFAVRDGALFTPPLDGRILPGITRMRVMEMTRSMNIELCEKPLARNDLLAADEVFITGSVRGIERVDSLDGAPLATTRSVASNLGVELWREWISAQVG